VNAAQTIDSPTDAQSFTALEEQLGLPPGLLEQSLRGGALGGGLGGGALGGGSLGGGSLGGGGGGGAGGNAIAKCLQQAGSQQEINACLTQ
jgi:hypothetical protein